MTNIVNLICAALIGCGLTALALPESEKVVTKTIVKEVPGPVQIKEVIKTEPADTTELDSLRVQLAAALKENERQAEATIAEWTKQAQKKSEACVNGSCQPAVSGQRFRLFGRRR